MLALLRRERITRGEGHIFFEVRRNIDDLEKVMVSRKVDFVSLDAADRWISSSVCRRSSVEAPQLPVDQDLKERFEDLVAKIGSSSPRT